MFLRTSSLAVFAALTACGKIAPEDNEPRVACAVNGAASFTDSCRVLSVGRGDGWLMTVRHPDGGFRRFAIDASGGVSAADGSEAVVGKPLPDGRLEIAVGGDRYRLPSGK